MCDANYFKRLLLLALGFATMSFGMAQAAPVETGAAMAQQSAMHELTVETTGIPGYDERGATSNTVLDFYVGSGSYITGVQWNVNVTSYAGSYLSEMQVTFSDTLGSGVTFTPGDGDDFDGTAEYAGHQDLAALGLVFQVGQDGILRLEFHDAFKDLGFDEPEGMWNSGTLTFGITPVPEPSVLAMVLGGLLLLSIAAAKRPLERTPSFSEEARCASKVDGAWMSTRSFHQLLIAVAVSVFAGTVCAAPKFEAAQPIPLYSYFATGDVGAEVTAPSALPTPSFVLMGGGPDVDSAFRWLIARAGIKPGTGGRFVVIRATGTEAYNPYIYYSDEALTTSTNIADMWVGGASLGLTSVETLVIPSVKAANSPAVNAIVARANVVFIAGGDQSDYIRFWKGTALERTLNTLMARNVPVGGTSAGLAVLGQFDYSALYKSATSELALLDPYYKDITFDPNPLSLQGGFIAPPALASLIFDSHFDSRDRMGRLIAFVSRIVAPSATPGGSFGCDGGVLPASSSGNASARGIGISVETALLVQGNGSGKPVTAKRVTNDTTTTESAVYFVRPSVAPGVCSPRTPLTISNVEVRKLADSDTVFDLTGWSGVPLYKHMDVISGTLYPADWY